MIGCDLWSDDPGFAAATATTGVTGVCGSGIIEVDRRDVPRRRHQPGRRDRRRAGRAQRSASSPNGRTFSYVLHRGAVPMQITQNDVRAIQLAKAALYAGVRLLMDELGIEQRRPHPAGRRLRQPHRREVRDGARA